MNVFPLRATLASCVLALACCMSPATAAQSTPAGVAPAPGTPATPAARPADVSSLDAIMHAVYAVISGPQGQQRDWDRMRSLFVPGARLIPVHAGKDGVRHTRMLGVEDYIRLGGPYLEKKGFFERETHRTVARYGAIAQVFSAYESRHAADDAKPFERGINSFQLLFDGKRWWVVNIYWQGETPDMPIPRQYGG